MNQNITLQLIEVYLKHAPGVAKVKDEDNYTSFYYLCSNPKHTVEMTRLYAKFVIPTAMEFLSECE